MTRAAKLAPLSRRMQPWLYLSPALLLSRLLRIPALLRRHLAFAGNGTSKPRAYVGGAR